MRGAWHGKKVFWPEFLVEQPVAAAVRHAKRPQNTGKTIVVILPDLAERYLSSILFEGMFDERGLTIE